MQFKLHIFHYIPWIENLYFKFPWTFNLCLLVKKLPPLLTESSKLKNVDSTFWKEFSFSISVSQQNKLFEIPSFSIMSLFGYHLEDIKIIQVLDRGVCLTHSKLPLSTLFLESPTERSITGGKSGVNLTMTTERTNPRMLLKQLTTDHFLVIEQDGPTIDLSHIAESHNPWLWDNRKMFLSSNNHTYLLISALKSE